MNIKTLIMSSLILTVSALSPAAYAQSSLGLGAKLLGTGWKGDNVTSGTEFESNSGGQLGFNLVYQYNRLYTGFNFQKGDYKFKDDAPDQVYESGSVQPSQDIKINRSEVDVLVGYYFWPKVSLFLDLKAIKSVWKDDDPDTKNYATEFGGLGLGVSGYLPLDDKWMLFGSFGVVPSGTIKQTQGEGDTGEIGSGNSGALELGAIYQFNRHNRLNFGLKTQWQNYQFDDPDSSEQKHLVGGLFLGYNYLFLFGQ